MRGPSAAKMGESWSIYGTSLAGLPWTLPTRGAGTMGRAVTFGCLFRPPRSWGRIGTRWRIVSDLSPLFFSDGVGVGVDSTETSSARATSEDGHCAFDKGPLLESSTALALTTWKPKPRTQEPGIPQEAVGDSPTGPHAPFHRPGRSS